MYVWVQNGFGAGIWNATFNYSAYNYGNGWYWVPIPDNAQVCASAPGYLTYCQNVGTAPSEGQWYIWFQLQGTGGMRAPQDAEAAEEQAAPALTSKPEGVGEPPTLSEKDRRRIAKEATEGRAGGRMRMP